MMLTKSIIGFVGMSMEEGKRERELHFRFTALSFPLTFLMRATCVVSFLMGKTMREHVNRPAAIM